MIHEYSYIKTGRVQFEMGGCTIFRNCDVLDGCFLPACTYTTSTTAQELVTSRDTAQT